MPEPTPTSEIDKELYESLRRSRNSLWLITGLQSVVLGVVTVIAIVLLIFQFGEHARVTSDITQVTSSECEFFLPLTIVPVQANTSKLGIELVEGARLAWHGFGCPGPLAPPAPELLQLARKYGVVITY